MQNREKEKGWRNALPGQAYSNDKNNVRKEGRHESL